MHVSSVLLAMAGGLLPSIYNFRKGRLGMGLLTAAVASVLKLLSGNSMLHGVLL